MPTLPGAKLKRIDDAAHFVMFDQPAAFFAELDAFIARMSHPAADRIVDLYREGAEDWIAVRPTLGRGGST